MITNNWIKEMNENERSEMQSPKTRKDIENITKKSGLRAFVYSDGKTWGVGNETHSIELGYKRDFSIGMIKAACRYLSK